jgi:hypothetical protein
MALTTTTLANAMAATDTQISVSSATGFAANQFVLIDQEWLKIINSYTSGTIIPVLRGQNGSTVVAHTIAANVITDAISSTVSSDWANAAPSVTTSYPLAGRARTITSYDASGAIALPTPGTDAIAILTGTSTLAMTLANPTTDMDGGILIVVGSGKSASTIDFPDATGLSGAGSSYDTITFQNGGQCALSMMALNGVWVLIGPPVTGTSTALSIAIA